MHRDIVYTVYLLDVLEESHTAQLLLDYYCTRFEVSVLRGGDCETLAFEAVCVSVCVSVHGGQFPIHCDVAFLRFFPRWGMPN